METTNATTTITSRQPIDQDRYVVTFTEGPVVGWGVEIAGALTIRGAMDAALVASMGGDAGEKAAANAAKLARLMRLELAR